MAYTIDPVINGVKHEQIVKVGDTLPIGTEVDYEGAEVPNGWEQIDDPNEYSTTEQVVGKWIDGKPVYRKVIDSGALPNATSKSVNPNISNLDIFTSIKGIAYSNDKTSQVIFPNANLSFNAGIITIAVAGGLIYIKTNVDLSSYANSYVIVEYTKTTD